MTPHRLFPPRTPRAVALGAAVMLGALGLAGCGWAGDDMPPKTMMAEPLAVFASPAPGQERLIQLARYYQNGRWKKIGEGLYTLRLTQTDPTSDRVTHLGFLIQQMDGDGGDKFANVAKLTVDGEPTTRMQLLGLLEGLDWPAVPPDYAQAVAATTPAPRRTPLDLSFTPAGTPYSSARDKFLEMGLKPAPIPHDAAGDTCGPGAEAICKAYPEIIDCTGMGANPCRAAFLAPDGRIVVAATEGDDLQNLNLTGVAFANDQDRKKVQNIIAGKAEDAP